MGRVFMVLALCFALAVVLFTMRGASKIASVLTFDDSSVGNDSHPEDPASDPGQASPESPASQRQEGDDSADNGSTQILEIGVAD